MLGKLMKYEFRATGRVFLPLFGLLIVVSAANRLLANLSFPVPKIIAGAVYGALIVAVFVIAFILTLQRFYRNLLGSEGYLMFTLPVDTDSLILSKMFVSAIWIVASFIVVVLAIFIMAATGINLPSVLDTVKRVLDLARQADYRIPLLVFEGLVFVIASLFAGILYLYACMALSLLVNRHRVGFAFLMYMAISIIGQALLGILFSAVRWTDLEDAFSRMSGYAQVQAAVVGMILLSVVSGAIFYFITRWMLQYKLNLE